MNVKEFNGDVEQIRHIAVRWQQEDVDSSLGIETDVNIYLAKLQDFVDNPDNILLILIDDDIVGYMGLNFFVSPMGNQLIANEHYFYVLPEKRGISALKFIPAAKKLAKERGCSHLMMSASNLASSLHDRTCKLYERFGFSKFETVYIVRV